MKHSNSSRWLMVASLAITGMALNVGCSSSGTSTPSDSGAGGSSAATGGHTGSGGTTGGSGGSTVVHLVDYTFDTTLQGWSLSTYADPAGHNLAGNYVTDGGTDAASVDAGLPIVAPTLTFDSAVGSPSPGSLKVTATFTDFNQYVDLIVNLNPTVDLTGKTLQAQLQVTSGTFSGGAQMHVGTNTDYSGYGQQPFILAPVGSFATATAPLATITKNAGFNAAAVIQLGVQMYSGSAGDAGAYANAGVPVVFNIDTFTD